MKAHLGLGFLFAQGAQCDIEGVESKKVWFSLSDVKYGLPVVCVWWRLWQVFLRDQGAVDVGARTHWWCPLAHQHYLPHTRFQSGQGRGDSEGGLIQVAAVNDTYPS